MKKQLNYLLFFLFILAPLSFSPTEDPFGVVEQAADFVPAPEEGEEPAGESLEFVEPTPDFAEATTDRPDFTPPEEKTTDELTAEVEKGLAEKVTAEVAEKVDKEVAKARELQKVQQEEQKTQVISLLPQEAQLKKKYEKLDPTLFDDEEEIIELNFENADLTNLVAQMTEVFDFIFVTDDTVKPFFKGGKGVADSKISFKTHKPLTKRQTWNLFTIFLELAGLAVLPGPKPGFYRITSTDGNVANRSALPAIIGVDPEQLPDSDEKIRFVYFLENAEIKTIVNILKGIRSRTASDPLAYSDLKALILTDTASNIKSMMRIVKELDRATMPETMSIIRLQRADAEEVAKLYSTLVAQKPEGLRGRVFNRKQSSALYFPEGTRMIPEKRTNSLILLGSETAIKKIEEFIVNEIDKDISLPYSPVRVHELKHADAKVVAEIMQKVTDFQRETEAAKAGGVRGQDKYFGQMIFTAEPAGNRLIVRGEEEDYLKAKATIEQLDEPQPQVAMEFLILSIDVNSTKRLGAQLRSKTDQDGVGSRLLGNNINFQTSGLFGSTTIVEKTVAAPPPPDPKKLLGDLIKLASGAVAGNTLLTLGSDQLGIWGIFQMLKTHSNTQLISNPFLLATNKTPAVVSLGETRRVLESVLTSGVGTQNSQESSTAELKVEVTPQINSDGMIVLDLDILVENFRDTVNTADATKIRKHITTQAIVADKEVLALGGLIRNRITDSKSKTPILGSIPILGWLFKNKGKEEEKENLLILISSRIIKPQSNVEINQFTTTYLNEYNDDLKRLGKQMNKRDPIDRWFFGENEKSTSKQVDQFVLKRHRLPHENNKKSKKPNKEVKQPAKVAQIHTTPTRKIRRGLFSRAFSQEARA